MSSTISDSTRATIGAGAVPSTVTTYDVALEIIPGFPVTTKITDGTNGNDVIAAAANATYVFGNAGNDTLSNQGSAAVLIGGAGSDVFRIYNNSASASLMDGSILDFTPGEDRIDLSQFGISSFDQLTITSTSAADATIKNEAASVFIQVSGLSGLNALNASHFIFGNDTGGGGNNDVTIDGDSGNNLLLGNLLGNLLRGLEGNDTIYGGGAIAIQGDGNDTIYGGAGNDSLYGNTGDDIIYGGNGVADPNDGHDFIAGGKGADTIYGNSGNDTIYGGGASADPSDQGDLVYGGKGADYILGNGGNDTLYGGGAVADPDDQGDTLFGGVGNDVIYGNGGDDHIYGQDGNDYLHGGVGNDTYYFTEGWGNDTIGHFEGAGVAGGDVIAFLMNDISIDEILSSITYSNGNAVLADPNGNSITIIGVTAGSLTGTDFAIIS